MARICCARGCALETTSRFSRYCAAHKARLRRHGSPGQAGVTKADLRPYVVLVRARIEKNHESPAWGHLESRWKQLTDHAHGVLAYYSEGRAGPAHERRAAQEIVKLAGAVEARGVVETVIAMFILQEMEPRRFSSDAGFRTQLVRRVRGLTDLNAGTYYGAAAGGLKRVYRELPPRATAVLGEWLARAFGGAGIHVARLEANDRAREQRDRRELQQALADLK